MGMQASGKLLTPQSMIDDEAAFMTSFEYRAAELIIRNLAPMLQSIQNAQDLMLQVESGFLKRKDMKERFEEFYRKLAAELAEQNGEAPTPDPEVQVETTEAVE